MLILEEFYDGNINPSERFIKKGSEYQKLSNQLMDDTEKFRSLLNNEEKQLYDKIDDIELQINSISERENFIDGFRIGAQMMWEVLNYKSENFR